MTKGKKGVLCELCGKELKSPRPRAEHHFCAGCWEKNGKSPIKIMRELRIKRASKPLSMEIHSEVAIKRLEDISS